MSRRDSPLLSELDELVKVITSAESRLAAASNESRVRVESSKNAEATVLPRSAGTLGIGRRPTSTKLSASRRTSSMPSRPRSETLSRCRGVIGPRRPARPGRRSDRPGRDSGSDHVPEHDAFGADVDHLEAAGGKVLADVVGTDRQFTVPSVDHYGELDDCRAAEVRQRIECRPDCPTGEQHIITEHYRRPAQVDRDLGRRHRQHRAQPYVISIESDVESPDRHIGARHCAYHLS